MQPETLNRSIQPTPTVHPRGFTPTSVQFCTAGNTPGPLTLGGGYLFTVDVKKRLQGEWLGLGLFRVLGLRRLARNGATVEGLAKRTGRTPDFIERALSWDAGSVSRWSVGSFGDLAPRGAQMSPRLDLRR